jgi:hypothetical protein
MMKSKIFIVLRALLLIAGMFALQGCFEEEYRGYEPGYAPAHRYSYESPRREWEEHEHGEHEEWDRD